MIDQFDDFLVKYPVHVISATAISFFELGLTGFSQGLLIFHKMSPRTRHNYL